MNKYLYRIIMIVLIGIIVVSGYHIGKTLYGYYQARHEYSKISEEVNNTDNGFTGDIDFDALLKTNPETQAWLYQEDGVIDYPVAKGSDNSKYLHHLLNGEYNTAGTLFIDYRCEDDFQGFHTIIYGHHMHDGRMFGQLEDYKDQDYFDEHSQMELITPTEKYHLMFFAGYNIAADSDSYQINFYSNEQKQAFLDYTKSNSIVSSDVDVTTEDRIVTLSTCAYEFDNARFVLIGKLVKWDE